MRRITHWPAPQRWPVQIPATERRFMKRERAECCGGQGSPQRAYSTPAQKGIVVMGGILSKHAVFNVASGTVSINNAAPTTLADYGRAKDLWFADLESDGSTFIPEKVEEFKRVDTLLQTCSASTLGEISTDTLLSLIRSPENGLKYMTSNSIWTMFVLLCERGEDSQLTRKDFNTILHNMVSYIPFHQPTPQYIPSNILNIYKKMKENGFSPDDVVHACLYRAFKDTHGHLKSIHNASMDLVKSRLSNPRPKFELDKLPPILSETSFRTLLACFSQGSSGKALSDIAPLWYDMKTCKIPPSYDICVGFLDLCEKCKDERLVMEIHKYMGSLKKSKPWNAYVYGRLMLAYASFAKWLSVQHLFQEMRNLNIPCDTMHYRAVFLATKEKDFLAERNHKYAGLMLEDKVFGDNDTYHEIIKACVKLSDGSGLRRLVSSPIVSEFEKRKAELEVVLQKLSASTTNDTIIKESLSISRGGLSPSVFGHIIQGYAQMADTSSVYRSFEQWKEICSFYTTSLAILEEFEKKGKLILTKPSSTKYILSTPSTSMLSSIVSCHGLRVDINGARQAFENEVFHQSVISRLWDYELKKHATETSKTIQNYKEEIIKLESDEKLMKNKYIKYKQDKIHGLLRRIKHLESAAESDEPRTLPFKLKNKIGLLGPFSKIYQAFIDSWSASISYIHSEKDEEVREMHPLIKPRLREYLDSNREFKEQEKAELLIKMEYFIDEMKGIEWELIDAYLRSKNINQ